MILEEIRTQGKRKEAVVTYQSKQSQRGFQMSDWFDKLLSGL